MEQTRLCVTVMAPTMEALRVRRDELSAADLVELRLDAVDRPDVHGALAGRRGPVLVTCRAAWEGGAFRGPELLQAIGPHVLGSAKLTGTYSLNPAVKA